MVDLESCIVVVKNVPSRVCSQCGEVSYNNEVAQQLEKIVHRVKESLNTEVAIVYYSDKAA
jgi:signal transduction protein with GAF and PtsI domain